MYCVAIIFFTQQRIPETKISIHAGIMLDSARKQKKKFLLTPKIQKGPSHDVINNVKAFTTYVKKST